MSRMLLWPAALALAMLLSPAALLAVLCPKCGADLPSSVNFCGVCGDPIPRIAPQPNTNPLDKTNKINHGTKPPLTTSEASLSQFQKLIAPLEAYEPEIRISSLRNNIPQVRTLIQLTLLPGFNKIKNGLASRGWRLTQPQSRILDLYKERYQAILDWSGTLGSEQELLFMKISQLTACQAYLLAVCDDEAMAEIAAITDVFVNELKNMQGRIQMLEHEAGFENPGIAYQIKRPDLPAGGDAFPFTFWIEPVGRRIGERMQVFDSNGRLLGRLQFAGVKNGIRQYTGTMSKRAFAALPARQVWIEYATKTKFSPFWKKERLKLFLMLSVPVGAESGFAFEAHHGTNPEAIRALYLKSIGRY